MTALPRRPPSWLVPAIVGAIVAIFVIDIFVPIGVTVAVLFVVPVYLSGWLPQRQALWLSSLAATLLIPLAALLSPPGGDPWIAWTNRLLAMIAVWLVLAVSLTQRRLSTEIKSLQGLLPICASCKKIRDERGQWQGLELYIRDHSEADFTHGLCPLCLQVYQAQIEQKAGA
jgi:hypothetical protein